MMQMYSLSNPVWASIWVVDSSKPWLCHTPLVPHLAFCWHPPEMHFNERAGRNIHWVLYVYER